MKHSRGAQAGEGKGGGGAEAAPGMSGQSAAWHQAAAAG